MKALKPFTLNIVVAIVTLLLLTNCASKEPVSSTPVAEEQKQGQQSSAVSGGSNSKKDEAPKSDSSAANVKVLEKAVSEAFGWALASNSDIDQDGVTDLLIGASHSLAHQGDGLIGKVYLFSGKTLAEIASLSGEENNDGFGRAVSFIPDLNSDGVDDILVGAVGKVFVYSGKNKVLLKRFHFKSSDTYGFAVKGLKDVNGDGKGDYAVADYRYGYAEGRVLVYSGATHVMIAEYRGQQGDKAGWSLDSNGDFDHDGVNDLIIGMAQDQQTDAGATVLFSPRLNTVIDLVVGPKANYQSGYSVAGLGDLDSDGYSEWIVGSIDRTMRQAGEAYVYSGRTSTVRNSFASGAAVTVMGQGVQFGSAVTALPDVDSDGVTDFVICDREVAMAHVFSGKSGSQITTIKQAEANLNLFGNSAVGMTDVNGDGKGELAIGAPLTGKVYVYLNW